MIAKITGVLLKTDTYTNKNGVSIPTSDIYIDADGDTIRVYGLDNYNGYLGDNRYYFMDDLDEIYTNELPTEILCRAFYGRDDDTWTTDSNGDKIYGEFNPNREYFYYNGYGNLVSADYKDYSFLIDEYAVNAMNENRSYIDTIEENEEIQKLFDELEEA